MLIEIIVVLAIILALYGFIDFTTFEGWVIFFSGIGGAFAAAYFISHLASKGVADLLFPSPKLHRDTKKENKIEEIKVYVDTDQLDMAETKAKDLVEKYPADKRVSDKLCDVYVKSGKFENCIDERRRLIAQGKLSMEEKCTIYNRIADLYIDKLENPDGAVFALRQLINEFPESPNAQFAYKRIEMIQKNCE